MNRPVDPHLREIDPFEGAEAEVDENLDGAAIERRATQGVGLLVGQMFGLQILTLGVTVVLARTLSIDDYGIFAIAIAIQQAGLALVELGVPASLINRENSPSLHEQRAVTGFVLVAAVSVCALVALVAFVVLPAFNGGFDAIRFAFVATLALPILAWRTIPTVLLERRLRYGRVTALYTADTIVFNLAALSGGLAGLGALSLVLAVPAGAFAGMIAAFALQRSSRGLAWDFGVIRPMISFGSQDSIKQGVILARDLVFVSLIATIGGQTAAGFYAMSQRVLGVPLAFSLALNRVGFPAMARTDEGDVRFHNAARSIAIASAAIGLVLAVCAGAAQPLLDFLFGSRWTPAADIVVPSAAGFLVMAGAGSIISSLRLSLGDAQTPMVSAIVDSAFLCGSAVFLIHWNSTTGVGMAIFIGAVAGVLVLLSRSTPTVRHSMVDLARAFAIAAVAATVGLMLPPQAGLVGVLVSASGSALTWLLLTFLFSRSELKLILGLVSRALKGRSSEEPLSRSGGRA